VLGYVRHNNKFYAVKLFHSVLAVDAPRTSAHSKERRAAAARRGLALPAFSRAAHSDAYIGAQRATPST